MIPCWIQDSDVDEHIPESKPGHEGERYLYKLMRDGLPDDWLVIYDKSIQARRQDVQIDFLVCVPDKGVCVVDAKGGKGYQKWEPDGIVALAPDDKDVFQEAVTAQHVFNNFVRDEISGGSDWGAYTSLVVFTDKDFATSISNGQPYLQKSDLLDGTGKQTAQKLKQTIEKLLAGDNGKWMKVWTYFPQWLEPLRERFCSGDTGMFRPMDFERMEKCSREGLDNEQLVIAEQIKREKYVHVRGAAGTGKTIIALKVANECAQEGKRVLYVCYNRALAIQCQQDNQDPNIVITHLDGLWTALGCLGSFQPEMQAGGKGIDRLATDRKMLAELPKAYRQKKQPKFDVLLVDEAQDFSRDNLLMLLQLAKNERNVGIFSDSCQTIFATDWELPKDLFERPVFEPPVLNKNYRNTEKIFTHFRDLSQESTIAMLTKARFPYIKDVCEDIAKEQIAKVLEELLTMRKPSQIAVLFNCDASAPNLCTVQGPAGAVELVGYNRDRAGNRRSLKDVRKYLRKWREDKCILMETIQSFKGLEANCVVLIAPNMPWLSEEENMRLRYVGESRAKYELYIVQLGGGCKMDDVDIDG